MSLMTFKQHLNKPHFNVIKILIMKMSPRQRMLLIIMSLISSYQYVTYRSVTYSISLIIV